MHELQTALVLGMFALGGSLVVFLTLALSRLLVGKARLSEEKLAPYESGEEPIGDTDVGINVNYYLFAVLFLLFDVEAGLVYAWIPAFDQLGLLGIVEVGLFLLILLAGLVYAWRKGVLKWVY